MTSQPVSPATKDTPSLEGDINALLTEMEQSTQRLANASAGGLAAPAAVEPAAGPGTAASPPAALEAIESLDAQLAELTAQLLDGKAPTGTEAVSCVEPRGDLAPSAAAPVSAVAVESPVSPKPAAETPASTPFSPSPAPVPAPTAANPPKPITALAAATAAAAPPPPVAPVITSPPRVLVLLSALSGPLAKRSPGVRAGVGLVGLNTLLIAGLLWAYLLFRPAVQHEEAKAYDLASETLPQPKVEEPAHGAAGGHGEKSEGHGEAEHGDSGPDAKKPDAKKVAKKPPAKKPPKKSGGHGEPAEGGH